MLPYQFSGVILDRRWLEFVRWLSEAVLLTVLLTAKALSLANSAAPRERFGSSIVREAGEIGYGKLFTL